MPPLYIIQQGSKIRIHNRNLQVELEEDGRPQVLLRTPLGHVSQVVLFGNIGLTTPAIDTLLNENVEVVFLTQDGDYRGRLNAGLTPHVPLRRAQYRCLDQPAFCLEMAQAFVHAKLEHQRALLLRHNREWQDPEIRSAADQAAAAMRKIEHKTALSSLRGLEGAASAAFFGGYRRLFDPVWRFNTRQRRPPPDPVNAMLSLGYTLLAQLAKSAVQTVGLDPFAGFLHEYAYNRPALALDLMEEFRPVVDGVVLWCCRSGQLSPADFVEGPPDRPVMLNERGLKVFIQAFEQRFDGKFTHPISGQRLSMRQCLVEQARQVAGCAANGQVHFRAMGFR